MYIYIYIYTYLYYIFEYIYIYIICIYAQTVCRYTNIYVNIKNKYLQIYMSVYIYIYIYIYMCVLYMCIINMFMTSFAPQGPGLCFSSSPSGTFLAKAAQQGTSPKGHHWEWFIPSSCHMGVSINGGSPKWMVYKGNPIKIWMIWGYPYFRKPPFGWETLSRSN